MRQKAMCYPWLCFGIVALFFTSQGRSVTPQVGPEAEYKKPKEEVPVKQLQGIDIVAVNLPSAVSMAQAVPVAWKFNKKRDPDDDWRTPIEFYGKVVDENTNPVANADIYFGVLRLFQWNDAGYI